jgi:hypothetical protein
MKDAATLSEGAESPSGSINEDNDMGPMTWFAWCVGVNSHSLTLQGRRGQWEEGGGSSITRHPNSTLFSFLTGATTYLTTKG